MSSLKERLANRFEEEKGAVLIFVAGSLLVLLGFVAFATDLGWFYLNASQAQRTADAAALAGVIRMPSDFGQATTDALDIAAANGFVDGLDGASVVVEEVFDTSGDQLPYQLKVTVTREVPAFFLNALGKQTETVTRSSVAEYIPPIPLGSRFNTFGNQAGCDPQPIPVTNTCPAFWANIHGRYTDTRMGDAFSSLCFDGTGSGNDGNCTNPLANPTFRDDGYAYGVEVVPGMTTFTVQFLDIEFRPGADWHRTGDHNYGTCSYRPSRSDYEADPTDVPTGCDTGPSVRVRVLRPDATPNDPFNNPPVAEPTCDVTYAPQPILAWNAPYSFSTHCTVDVAAQGPGIYVVQVQVIDQAGSDDDWGLNRYAVRVQGAPTNPRLFGINDFSLFNNFSGSNTVFDLAEIAPSYRGEELILEMYDPGDVRVGDSNVIHIVHPSGADAANCRVFWKEEIGDPWIPWEDPNPSPCTVDATRTSGNDNFQGDWIRVEIDLPDTYNCDGGMPLSCWWSIRYEFGGGGNVQDTTTWRAFIEGNPVHLLPGS